MPMSTTLIVIAAIIAWAAIRIVRLNTSHLRNGTPQQDALPDESETRRELEELRERIKVLERIATDGNTPDARETRRIAEEIEALRDQQRS